MKNKDTTIDILKGIAILLVVYGHVIQRTMAPQGADFFLNPAFEFIYTFHMPLFFFLSGYLMAFTLEKRTHLEAFGIRCKTLLVPFLAWGILGVITTYILRMVDHQGLALATLPQETLDQLLIHPMVWFLFTLFILSVLLLISVRMAKDFSPMAFVWVYFLLLIIPDNDHFCLFYIKWFYLFYVIGYFINKYQIRIDNRQTKTIALLISSILFVLLLKYWSEYDYIYINKMGFGTTHYFLEALRVVYRYSIGFLGIFIIFQIGSYCSKHKTAAFFAFLGVYAFDIYLIQRYVVEGLYPRLVSKVPIHLNFNSPVFMMLIVPLITALSVALCIFISKSLIRSNDLLKKLLLGDRS